MSGYTPSTGAISMAFEDWMDYLGKPRTQSRAEFDRWLAAHDAALRAVWEAEGRRWFTPAYRALSGNIITFGDETVVQEHARRQVDQFTREDPEGPDYFVATRVLPPWVPVEQGDGS